MDVFAVHAYRFSDYEKHSYIVGVYDDKELAKEAAVREEEFRGGKYGCVVYPFKMNKDDISSEDDVWKTSFFERESKRAIANRIENIKIMSNERLNGEPDDWQ